jgi:hypothetical protein
MTTLEILFGLVGAFWGLIIILATFILKGIFKRVSDTEVELRALSIAMLDDVNKTDREISTLKYNYLERFKEVMEKQTELQNHLTQGQHDVRDELLRVFNDLKIQVVKCMPNFNNNSNGIS